MVNICESLKYKKIIVAEHKDHSEKQIVSILRKQGFHNIDCSAATTPYEILLPCVQQPDDIGLVILHEDLLDGSTQDISQYLFSEQAGIFIPLLLLRRNQKNDFIRDAHRLIYFLNWSCRASELLMAVDFLLLIKSERSIRHQQEERLITELAKQEVNKIQRQLEYSRDELTGLGNRRTLEMRLLKLLQQVDSGNQHGALLYIDIDRFNFINELAGYAIGQELIIKVAALIRGIYFGDFLLTRINTDNFCLLIENRSINEVVCIAENVRRQIDDTGFIIANGNYKISVSIGIASILSSKPLSHPEELISRAHQACQMAKVNGRNMTWKYNEKEKDIEQRQLDVYWSPLIKAALSQERFFLVFQPVVNLGNGIVSHYEVLIRMRGIDGETIYPGEFIQVAERMGLIHSIDSWVVETSIKFLAALPPQSAHVALAINLSSVAFQDAALLPKISEQLLISGINANRITFEITETAAVENYQQTREMIDKIRALGCHFALDDFGAGFCSFNYLKNFPVDYIKIDGQFIKNLIHDETDQVLVKSMTEIARKLGKSTIAEFVECSRSITLLQEIGVNFGQGYIFGKPNKKLLETESILLPSLSTEKKQHSLRLR